jgi:hypothetical protein
MAHTNLKQRLDGLISNFEELPEDETTKEVLEYLRSAKDCLEGYDLDNPEPREGQPA